MFSPHYTCPSLARFSYINLFTTSFANCECSNVRITLQECASNFTSWACLLAIKLGDKWIPNFVFTGASNEPKCEISCRLGDRPKNEETVDPDSSTPSHCSIKNGGNISRNMTWKEVNDKITPKPGVVCLVLKTGNSEKRIYFASKCCDSCYQRWPYNGQKSISNEYLVDSKVADELGSTRLVCERTCLSICKFYLPVF